VCGRITGSLVPRSRLGLGISTGPNGISSTAVHRRLSPAASSSRELCASSRVRRQTACPLRPKDRSLPRPESASPRVSSLIATSTGGVHSCPRSHPRADVPSSAFRTPSTVCSATGLAGLFRPAATSRVCPAGVCPSPRSRTGFPRPIHALLPLTGAACGLTRASGPDLDFRALLPATSAVSTGTV